MVVLCFRGVVAWVSARGVLAVLPGAPAAYPPHAQRCTTTVVLTVVVLTLQYADRSFRFTQSSFAALRCAVESTTLLSANTGRPDHGRSHCSASIWAWTTCTVALPF